MRQLRKLEAPQRGRLLHNGRMTDKSSDKSGLRLRIDRNRRTLLLQTSLLNNQHFVSHFYRLVLIMRDEDGGDA
ncbi:hypothetical protein D3C85_1861340 [compost metagenome]